MVTFSDLMPYKNILRKEHIHKKDRKTIYMALYTFMSDVQFLNLF